MTYVVAYLSTAVVFLGLDLLWLTRIAIGFYRRNIGDLMLASPNLGAAGVFYLFYIAGIVYFAVLPAVNANTLSTAIINGALLGLLAYGTYDLTNLATLNGFTVKVAVVDMVWGTSLTAICAVAGRLVADRLS